MILLCTAAIYLNLPAQYDPVRYDISDILLRIKKLHVLGSALYIAAHPDDENTAMLAYLANGRLVRTGYLALTRGEGGQNLIGNETGCALGVLRSQELLAARQIDGAEQFFGGAEDFGYSKSSDETLEKWEREKILARMVAIIRAFRPDVIITRFSTEQGGHGHHLSSAILALEAFTAAADPARFPEQFDTLDVWQSKRILWNSWRPQLENRGEDLPPLLTLDLGTYNAVIGMSYLEVAAESRSMHKSQGFGSAPQRGSYINYFEHTAGIPAQSDIFDGIDLTWNRVPGGVEIERAITALEAQFDSETPSASIPLLLNIRKTIAGLTDPYWRHRKLIEIDQLIRACAGLWLNVMANDYAYVTGAQVEIQAELVNRGNFPVTAKSLTVSALDYDTLLSEPLAYNALYELNIRTIIPESMNGDMIARFSLIFDTTTVDYNLPVRYFWTDRVKGEQVRPVGIVPPLTVDAGGSVFFFGDARPRKSGVTVKSWKDSLNSQIILSVPAGWRIEPAKIFVTINNKYGEKFFPFTLYPPPSASSGKLKFTAGSALLRHQVIAYDHIPAQLFLTSADQELVSTPLKIISRKIGYIMGSGDEIPADLSQIGYNVNELTDLDIEQADFSKYDVLIAGTRAFNTREKLHLLRDKFMQYVQNGGTIIVLHNTRFGLQPENIGPYPFTVGRDRVSVEDAPVNLIQPYHRLLTFPNPISQADFDGWVQERGLYFASEWDDHYQTIISCNDPGEAPKAGGILYAPYGNGHFIYAAYSWFRQLPAGVTGAYKLFINLISIGADQ